MFYRIHSDGTQQMMDLRGFYAGTTRTPCWLIGGGPSLASLPTMTIARSPAPKFMINLAGHGLLRPDFWTAYDPTARFFRSTYLDPSIVKFVHRRRVTDLVPGTTTKLGDSPATLCFDRDPQRGYHNFLAGRMTTRDSDAAGKFRDNQSGESDHHPAITDWQDSLIQAIEIAYHLGFRTLYLAGCDLHIAPSDELRTLGESAGVSYRPLEPLRDFLTRCGDAGLSAASLHHAAVPAQYHFDESKSLAAAVQTDLHYFRVTQHLRLSRRAMSLAGLELVSVTPVSRLNDFFSTATVDSACAAIHELIGDPDSESTRGRYTGQEPPRPTCASPMRDYPPHNWNRSSTHPPPPSPQPVAPPPSRPGNQVRREKPRVPTERLPEVAIDINEEG
ncbi:MAG: hypothetical protein R3B90_05625 [Planctomycetaceae bacterium]